MTRISLLLVGSFILVSCAVGTFPKFPELKEQYLIRVKGAPVPKVYSEIMENLEQLDAGDCEVCCIKFDVLSVRPYKIKLVGVVDFAQCNLIGGYKPQDVQSVLNWADDVHEWAKDRKHCFKN